MNKRGKIVFFILISVLVFASLAVWWVYNKPHRNVANEKGIAIHVDSLVNFYLANEAEANKKYLDKAIQVTGIPENIALNQDSMITVTFKSNNINSAVYCTLKKTEKPQFVIGAPVTVKGICTGILSDVVLVDAIIVK